MAGLPVCRRPLAVACDIDGHLHHARTGELSSVLNCYIVFFDTLEKLLPPMHAIVHHATYIYNHNTLLRSKVCSLHGIAEHAPALDSAAKSGAQQESPAQLPMQTIGFFWRWCESFPHHDWDKLLDPVRDGLLAEVIDLWRRLPEWFR